MSLRNRVGFARIDEAICARHGGPRQPPTLREFVIQTAICAVFIVGCFFGFTGRNQSLADAGAVFFCPVTPLDAYVPFVPWLVVVYLAFYPTFFAIAIVTVRDRRVMYCGVVAYISCAFISLIVFFMLPSRMLQPPPPCSGIACDILVALRTIDRDFHVFPSLHVAYPLCIWFFFRRYAKTLAALLVVECALIPLSTVMLKRHVLLDLPPGLLLGAGAAYFGFAMGPHYHRFMQRLGWAPTAPNRQATPTL